MVVNLTLVPSSVQPEAGPAPVSLSQETLPAPSVVSLPPLEKVVQFKEAKVKVLVNLAVPQTSKLKEGLEAEEPTPRLPWMSSPDEGAAYWPQFLPITAEPITCSWLLGEVVPIPKLPWTDKPFWGTTEL